MDPRRLDALARTLAAARTRRTALRLLAGSVLGGLLTHLGLEEAAAACRAPAKPCKKGSQCCSKKCSKRGKCLCTKATQCPRPSTACQMAVCTAKGTCVTRNKTDGAACDGGTCQNGTCTPTACTPQTCAELGLWCGPADDGCGGHLQCGDCDDGFACTYDSCNPQTGCVSVADDQWCSTTEACRVGRCDPFDTASAPNEIGCVFKPAADGTSCPDGGSCCGGVCVTTLGQACEGGGGGSCTTVCDGNGNVVCPC